MTNSTDSTYIDRRTALKALGASTVALGGVTGLASAAPTKTVFALDFATGSGDADDVGTNTAGWQVDRSAPETWDIATFDGDGRLHINIDESGPTSGFYNEQGKKYLPQTGGHWATGHNSTLRYSFYIDPDWEDDGGTRQQTGMWGVVGNANSDIVAYPVLEYQDSDAATNPNEGGPPGDGAQFRMFQQTGEWVNLGLPRQTRIDPDEGGWVDVEFRFLFDGGNPRVQYHVNNALIGVDDTIDMYGDPALFLEPILNSENYGNDEDYYYDDIALIEPGR
jgi:hypothetical protein